MNSAYSVATGFEDSYSAAAYLNNYSYTSWGAAIDIEFMTPTIEVLDYSDHWENFVLSAVIEKETPVFFKNPHDFLPDLQKIISEGEIVKLNVDLFYWLPKNIAWNRFHMSHYSIINGFDAETKMYSVLDDDVDGYGVHTIPEDRVVQAFMNSYAMTELAGEIPHAYIYSIRKDIEPFRMDKSEIIKHADRLIEELSVFSFDDLWNFKDEHKDNMDEYIRISLIGVNIIENRHIGNELLINKLADLKLIQAATYESMKHYAKSLQKGWKLIKQVFINNLVSENKDINVDLIRNKANEMLDMEKKMWLTIVEERDMKLENKESKRGVTS
ncbi:hypothetical protein [Paenibacillus solani]|uniref:hypothetical protein n=1 Tax=Paenibacillus solani TaxID=1705565 RepID=UPI0013F4EF35|nr:hypothetical protein [Paenibacillus solani]